MKDLAFNKAARRDYGDLPRDIQTRFGRALNLVQLGIEPVQAKALQGFGGRDVLELRDDDEAGTYRAVYTVRFEEVVYVLHAFQKKSKKGIKTAAKDIALIQQRLKAADEHHQANYPKKGEERRR